MICNQSRCAENGSDTQLSKRETGKIKNTVCSLVVSVCPCLCLNSFDIPRFSWQADASFCDVAFATHVGWNSWGRVYGIGVERKKFISGLKYNLSDESPPSWLLGPLFKDEFLS
ncbi:hypothetical protein RHMOL_Rhmol10G0122300 [Rhododendron molle]|uniref:Uncharacterized protein n=1 Tax=Rhododendron molle TaxID=49168 RepID=A0ACC0M1K5_RHOML|nr:hypothetical protein RHMOL_Rhmol10G0122300 [Rhododendron molle]